MPDTGEKGELRQRVNAKEAEIAAESAKVTQTSKPRLDRELGAHRVTTKKKKVKGH